MKTRLGKFFNWKTKVLLIMWVRWMRKQMLITKVSVLRVTAAKAQKNNHFWTEKVPSSVSNAALRELVLKKIHLHQAHCNRKVGWSCKVFRDSIPLIQSLKNSETKTFSCRSLKKAICFIEITKPILTKGLK